MQLVCLLVFLVLINTVIPVPSNMYNDDYDISAEMAAMSAAAAAEPDLTYYFELPYGWLGDNSARGDNFKRTSANKELVMGSEEEKTGGARQSLLPKSAQLRSSSSTVGGPGGSSSDNFIRLGRANTLAYDRKKRSLGATLPFTQFDQTRQQFSQLQNPTNFIRLGKKAIAAAADSRFNDNFIRLGRNRNFYDFVPKNIFRRNYQGVV